MPAIKQISTPDHQILIWKIDEDIEFFSRKITLSLNESQEYALIKAAKRKLEWMATRFVQRQVVDDFLIKDTFGKPFLQNKKGFVSLSHCKNYAVAAYAPHQALGVDIEPVHEKILRIADKFMSKNEFAFIDEKDEPTHLIACWSIKEAVYKSYGKKNLNFKEQIQIEAFQLSDNRARVNLVLENKSIVKEVFLHYFDDLVLAYS